MKLIDRERVDGTRVSIGRRVQQRPVLGTDLRELSESSTYTAVYIDLDGRRREEGLSTTNKREARRKAIEIAKRLEEGTPRDVTARLPIGELLTRYEDSLKAADLAPKSRAKYAADLAKLKLFIAEQKIVFADQFDEHRFYRYRVWLLAQPHKQGVTYSPKSVSAALTLAKQAFKWAWKRKLLREYPLATAKLPKAKAKPQPCFTTAQVDAVLEQLADDPLAHSAVTILAFSGMRVGELIQLTWRDVPLPADRLGMFHIRRGGSRDTTKDKDDRFVPVHPRIRPILDHVSKSKRQPDDPVLPGVKARTLLTRLKSACKAAGLGSKFKVHSLRHHFASLVANNHVSFKKALAWLGHADSEMLSNYYHLHDDESEQSMRALAGSTLIYTQQSLDVPAPATLATPATPSTPATATSPLPQSLATGALLLPDLSTTDLRAALRTLLN